MLRQPVILAIGRRSHRLKVMLCHRKTQWYKKIKVYVYIYKELYIKIQNE